MQYPIKLNASAKYMYTRASGVDLSINLCILGQTCEGGPQNDLFTLLYGKCPELYVVIPNYIRIHNLSLMLTSLKYH